MNPVGIFQSPRVAGEQCFSCTTSTLQIFNRVIQMLVPAWFELAKIWFNVVWKICRIFSSLKKVHWEAVSKCRISCFLCYLIGMSLLITFVNYYIRSNHTSLFSLMTNPPTPTWCDALAGSMLGPSGIQ